VFPRYEWEDSELVRRPVWLYPAERWHDPATNLGPHHDSLREAITAELERLIAQERSGGK
jgi:hypothetical protein